MSIGYRKQQIERIAKKLKFNYDSAVSEARCALFSVGVDINIPKYDIAHFSEQAEDLYEKELAGACGDTVMKRLAQK